MRNVILVSLMVAMASLSGCGAIARHWGGTMNVDLPINTKLVNCQWDAHDNLWYITKPVTQQDTQETYEFKEDSNFGVMNGTVIIDEHKE